MALRRSISVGQSIRGRPSTSSGSVGPRRSSVLTIGPGLPKRPDMWGSSCRAFVDHSGVQDRGNRLAFAGLGALIAGGAGVYWALRPTAVEEVYITDRTASIARLFDSANDECATGHPYDARSRLWQWYFKAKRLVFLCTVFLPVAGMSQSKHQPVYSSLCPPHHHIYLHVLTKGWLGSHSSRAASR
jgi:hypothetical protein